jgi:hypothetical protein
VIPRSVEILCSIGFSKYKSFSSISSESNSGLKRIEAQAFFGTSVPSVVIPSMVCFIASTAFHPECQMSVLDGSSRPE